MSRDVSADATQESGAAAAGTSELGLGPPLIGPGGLPVTPHPAASRPLLLRILDDGGTGGSSDSSASPLMLRRSLSLRRRSLRGSSGSEGAAARNTHGSTTSDDEFAIAEESIEEARDRQ